MFRTLLQLAAILAAVGAVQSVVNERAPQDVKARLMELLRLSGNAESQEIQQPAENVLNTATKALENIKSDRLGKETIGGPMAPVGDSSREPKAFYNSLPSDCGWEKLIDPATRTVQCSLPERCNKR